MSEEKTIFLVTTIRPFVEAGTRCVGFFHTLEEAKDVVIYNRGDINEDNYYPYCVIEEVEAGLYRPAIKEYWYKWSKIYKTADIVQTQYTPIEKPKKFSNIICFGIG